MKRASEKEALTALQDIACWKRKDEKWIERRFKFQEFMEGIGFVDRIAEIAEDMEHHPFISIQYKVVTLSLTSWNERGLTALDFEAAFKYNQIYDTMK
ncbi:4a-hydroxytetrahydrobiopterin dehydratase [Bacillus salacetis]|uniref:4a-hydroxytetrahydrobiopterin dehydratase n=1 Tax=Bacillus salacetis TaxID=2315464 RepID=A0A3A1QWQ6_9BACI|nr:4a-hydroxytetrahydrobiopterin dehydratase [Bacillus salacetis]RIW32688.1 4a-hydroxytetrahydrobiopterin dehydratase [Bacillus salacetis]